MRVHGQSPVFNNQGKLVPQNLASNTKRLTANHIVLDAVYFWSWNKDSMRWNNTKLMVDSAKQIDFTYDPNYRNVSFKTCNDTSNDQDSGLFVNMYNSNSDTTSVHYNRKLMTHTGWEDYSMDTIVYNTNNNITDKEYLTYNGSSWDNIAEYIYQYDANNNLTSLLNTSHSAFFKHNTYSYNTSNQLIIHNYNVFNLSTPVNIYRDTITYNVNNYISSEKFYNMNSTDSLQVLNTYDVYNNLTSKLTQTFFGTWTNSTLYTYSYDSHNNLKSKLYQTWKTANWVNDSLDVYAYNANDSLMEDTFKIWGNPGWLPRQITTFMYDANNNLVIKLKQNWNISNSKFDTTTLNKWTYDANHLMLSKVYQGYNSSGSKVLVGDSVYYYYLFVSSINNLPAYKDNILVYPNPGKGIFDFLIGNNESGIKSIEVYNMLGQQIYSQFNIPNSIFNIDLSSQPSGVYFYRCIDSKGNLAGSGKLIIQK